MKVIKYIYWWIVLLIPYLVAIVKDEGVLSPYNQVIKSHIESEVLK